MAAGAAAANVGTLGGVLTGTLPNPGLATGSVTTTQIADGTIATADLANAAVTNAKLAADTARDQLLTNGGFEVWQRGNGPFTTGSAYGPDRWQIYATAGTTSVTRDTATADVGSLACAQVITTAPPALGNGIFQIIDCGTDNPQLRGRTLTLSARVRCAQANSVRLELVGDKGVGLPHTTVSAYHSGGSTYETLTVSIALPAGATGLTVWVLGVTAGTWYVDNLMLVVGSQAADYVPLHPAEDLARCMRYWQKSNTTNANIVQVYGTAGLALYFWFPMVYPMGGGPTMTKIGTPGLSNCNQPSAYSADACGYAYFFTVTAAGGAQVQWGAASYWAFEWNP
jgi:hypothetical protein